MPRSLRPAIVAAAAWMLFVLPSAAPASAACTAPTGAYASAVLADAPVAYYRLDDPSAPTICDSSSSANNGTYTASGVTYGVAGAMLKSPDNAVAADGTAAGIGTSNAPVPITGNSSFTLESWFRSTGSPRNQALVDFGGTGNGRIAGLTVWNSASFGSCTTPNGSTVGLDEWQGVNCWDTTAVGINEYDGTWHHLAVTYDATANKLTAYIDGLGLGQQTPTNTGAFSLTSSPVRIGYWVDTTLNQHLVGDEDEVAVYGSSLSAAQIDAHYKAAGYATTVTSVAPDAGPAAGGNAVTITGTNFSTGAKVSFGGTLAQSVTVVSPTQIQATPRSHAPGAVHVTVKTPLGTSKTSNADLYAFGPPAVTGVSPTTGPTAGKTTVTITGSGFVPGATVSFGSTPSTKVTLVSGTKIKAVAPKEAAGTVDVTVTTPEGQSAASSADAYTYAAAPTVTGLSAHSGSTAGGDTITVSGTNFTPDATVRFSTTPAASVTYVSPTQLTVVTPAHAAGSTQVRVTTAGGMSATSANDVYTFS